ncbi:MAG: hypothetical protein H0V52_05050 [Acidimicrobiia bacterium]|nr:hypothetical protein [Acidimicrobiia bacterium]
MAVRPRRASTPGVDAGAASAELTLVVVVATSCLSRVLGLLAWGAQRLIRLRRRPA